MRRLMTVPLVLVVMSGCKSVEKSGAASTSARTSPESAMSAPSAAQLEALVRGFDAMAQVMPSERARVVAPLMQETIAPDDACFAEMGKVRAEEAFDLSRVLACARPCVVDTDELDEEAEDTLMPALRTQCEMENLGIAEPHRDLLTPQLLLVARAARLLQEAHGQAPAEQKVKLADAMELVSIPLPMPAWTQDYRLPAAPVELATMITPERYLVVGQDTHVLRPTPTARFTPSGLAIAFPSGEPIGRGRANGGRYRVRKDNQSPDEARQQALEQARRGGILGELDERRRPAPTTVLLADGRVEAARAIALADKLGGAVLGVTANSPIARGLAHHTPLRTPVAEMRWDGRSTQLIVALDDANTWVSSMPAGDHREIPRVGRLIDFEAVNEAIRELRTNVLVTERNQLAVHVRGEVPYRELVDVIAALSESAPGTVFRVRALPPGPELTTRNAIGTGATDGARSAGQPDVRLGKQVATGGLDKNIIRRYIRRALPRIRYCYERVLAEQPDLAGTVMVVFSITAEGKTDDIEASGLHAKVDSCIAEVFETIQFPRPTGDGSVQVRYPLAFEANGSE